jgi:23S rRNA (guanosine2251-2'-O)-methyltransferase
VEPDAELVAGRRPVEEAFAARREARRLLVVPQRRAALEALVLHATTLRIPVVELDGGSLTSLAGFDGHQGVALVVGPRPHGSLQDLFARATDRQEPPFVLVLDSLEDPQNLGTLLRSAEACAVHGVIYPTRRAAPLTPAAVKASAGAVEHLLLVPVDDLAAALVSLHSRGLRIVGADADARLPYREADLRGPLALVVGSEGRGVSGTVRRRLDLAVRIPMAGRVASLNAAVAGSVLLFEAAAQRGGKTGAGREVERSPRFASDVGATAWDGDARQIPSVQTPVAPAVEEPGIGAAHEPQAAAVETAEVLATQEPETGANDAGTAASEAREDLGKTISADEGAAADDPIAAADSPRRRGRPRRTTPASSDAADELLPGEPGPRDPT